jgi:hypothetical protein
MDVESIFDKMQRENPELMFRHLLAATAQSALHMHPVTDEEADELVARIIPLIEAHTRAAVEAERAACEAVARHHADNDGPVGLTEYYRGRGIACDEIAATIAAREAQP